MNLLALLISVVVDKLLVNKLSEISGESCGE